MLAVMAIGASTALMANATQDTDFRWDCCADRGNGVRGRLMWNEDGTFMCRESFETRLDELIVSGVISETDRDFFLERFDFCLQYRADARGIRGACSRNDRSARRQGSFCRNR